MIELQKAFSEDLIPAAGPHRSSPVSTPQSSSPEQPPGHPPDGDSEILVRPESKQKLQRPRMYRVLLHNDDYTPRDFVVMILQAVFHLSEADATTLMLYVHKNGVGVVGLYPFAVAETKVAEVLAAADQANFPLLCSLEPEDDGDEAGEDEE